MKRLLNEKWAKSMTASDPMNNPYDSIAEDWHASRTGFSARKYVDLVFSKLKPGAKLLDVGCGTGVPIARYLINNGFQVVGIDQSAGMLTIARRVLPTAQLIQANICDLELKEHFAAVIAWDSVFHIERSHHREIYRRLYHLLQPGGWLLLSAGGSGDQGFTSEMFGQSFFYSGYDPDETLRLLQGESFDVEVCEQDDPSSRGHIAIVARRAT